jgi:hypothetical protein
MDRMAAHLICAWLAQSSSREACAPYKRRVVTHQQRTHYTAESRALAHEMTLAATCAMPRLLTSSDLPTNALGLHL